MCREKNQKDDWICYELVTSEVSPYVFFAKKQPKVTDQHLRSLASPLRRPAKASRGSLGSGHHTERGEAQNLGPGDGWWFGHENYIIWYKCKKWTILFHVEIQVPMFLCGWTMCRWWLVEKFGGCTHMLEILTMKWESHSSLQRWSWPLLR